MPVGPKLNVEMSEVGDRPFVALSGDVDLASSSRVSQALQAFTDSEVVLDLRKVDFMDSTGLKMLIGERSRLDAAGGSLVLVVGDGVVNRLLEMTGTADRFRIVSSIEDLAAE